jgi:hypothetical protein
MLRFLCWYFSGWWVRWLEWGIEVIHCYCVSLCVFMYRSICLIKLGTIMFSTHMFTVVKYSWCIVLFINMNKPSLSLPSNFVLKSALSNVSIALPAFFQVPFCLEFLFLFFYFQAEFVLSSNVHFLQAENSWVLFF